jgi:hypothetical protein
MSKKERVEVELSEAEVIRRGVLLAERVQQRKSVDNSRKKEVSKFQKELKAIDAEIAELAKAVSTGKGPEFVEVDETVDLKAGVRITKRASDGKVLKEEKLTVEELEDARQMTIEDVEKPKKKAAR